MMSNNSKNKLPISSPSYPKQYRAIGLISGKYTYVNDKISTGFITTRKGQIIEAVLLGKVFCLVENHLDLTHEQTWIVYPRTNQDTNKIQLQITGIWQPKTIHENSLETKEKDDDLPIENLYFSIRGEIVFYSKKEEKIIVKIVQLPCKKSPQSKSFKLQLKGTLSDDCLGHFFNLDVYLKGDDLIVENATDLGFLPLKKMKFSKNYPIQKNLSKN